MDTLPGMPIIIGRVSSVESSSIEYRYKVIETNDDWKRLSGGLQYLTVGQTKRVWEFFQNVPFIFLVIPYLRYVTNVDGVLVKSFMRRPSQRLIEKARKAAMSGLATI